MSRHPEDEEPTVVIVTTAAIAIPYLDDDDVVARLVSGFPRRTPKFGAVVVANLQPGERRAVEVDGRAFIVHRQHVM